MMKSAFESRDSQIDSVEVNFTFLGIKNSASDYQRKNIQILPKLVY